MSELTKFLVYCNSSFIGESLYKLGYRGYIEDFEYNVLERSKIIPLYNGKISLSVSKDEIFIGTFEFSGSEISFTETISHQAN